MAVREQGPEVKKLPALIIGSSVVDRRLFPYVSAPCLRVVKGPVLLSKPRVDYIESWYSAQREHSPFLSSVLSVKIFLRHSVFVFPEESEN